MKALLNLKLELIEVREDPTSKRCRNDQISQ